MTVHFSKLSFSEYIDRVNSLIGFSFSNAEILSATARFGFDESRLKKGEKVLASVRELDQKQEAVIKEKVDAHQERRKLHTAVRKDYMKYLQIARIAFDKEGQIAKALQLEGPREVNLDAWIDQVTLFCSKLLGEKEWMTRLSEFGISSKNIEDLLKRVDSLRSLAARCEMLKDGAKSETARKRAKLKELQRWVSDYLKIARIALEDKPELYKEMLK